MTAKGAGLDGRACDSEPAPPSVVSHFLTPPVLAILRSVILDAARPVTLQQPIADMEVPLGARL